MGVTIHYSLAQEPELIKGTLDYAQDHALAIANQQAGPLQVPMRIQRPTDNELFIDIGGCETLTFNFVAPSKFDDLQKRYAIDDFNPRLFKDDNLYVADGFCKTQFASKSVEHKWVADIIKTVAKQCVLVSVSDEGGYYHSGRLTDAIDAIVENGKMIDSLLGKLGGLGYEVQQGGQTKIKKEIPVDKSPIDKKK